MSKEFWTRDKLVQLCQLFELKPVLWNINDIDYKNKYKRKDALDSISAELGINNANEVKKKIDSILVQYRREKKLLVTTSGMGTDEKKKPWWGMQYLQFLGDKMTPRPTFSNSVSSGSQIEGDSPDEHSVGESSSAIGTASEGQTSAPSSRSSTPGAAKRFKKPNKSAEQEEAYKIMKECYEGIKDSDRDEHSVYADHLANRMRCFKNKKRLCILKHEIEQLLFKAEMEEIKESEEATQTTRQTLPMAATKEPGGSNTSPMGAENDLGYVYFPDSEFHEYTSL